MEYGTYEEATGLPKPEYIKYNGVRFMNLTTVQTESAYEAKDHDLLMITSEKTNQWDAPKSYEIGFDHTIHSQTFPKEHPIGGARPWADANLHVTKYKDDEIHCSYHSHHVVAGPIRSYDLNEFMNNESVVDEDLVFWIMIGKEHYPKAEDIPVVSNFGSGFTLKPRNMFDRAAYDDLAAPANKLRPCADRRIFQCVGSTV